MSAMLAVIAMIVVMIVTTLLIAVIVLIAIVLVTHDATSASLTHSPLCRSLHVAHFGCPYGIPGKNCAHISGE